MAEFQHPIPSGTGQEIVPAGKRSSIPEPLGRQNGIRQPELLNGSRTANPNT